MALAIACGKTEVTAGGTSSGGAGTAGTVSSSGGSADGGAFATGGHVGGSLAGRSSGGDTTNATGGGSALRAWRDCGTFAPAPADVEATFSPDGSEIAVQDEQGAIRAYGRGGDARIVDPQAPGTMLYEPESGALLVVELESGSASESALVLRDAGTRDAVFRFTFPPSAGCSAEKPRFSVDQSSFFTQSDGVVCVFAKSTNALVASFSEPTADVAVLGQTVVTAQITDDFRQIAEVTTRDFSGGVLRRTPIFSGSALAPLALSPSGDRIVTGWDPPILWDTVTGEVVHSGAGLESGVTRPLFSRTGDRVLMGRELVSTADGGSLGDGFNGPPWPNAWHETLSLAPDGARALTLTWGRAELRESPSFDILRVLGPPALPSPADRTPRSLAISEDGSLLVAQVWSGQAAGIRVGPSFSTSEVAWFVSAGDVSWISDVSADGAWVTAAGDNRNLFTAQGRGFRSAPPPGQIKCWGSELRMSPNGTYAAGTGYSGTLDVFTVATIDLARPLLSLPANCFDSATFSRDETLMATSTPALFKTSGTKEGWTHVWGNLPERPDHSDPVEAVTTHVKFSPDERSVLVSNCNRDTCVNTLRDVQDGSVVRELPELAERRPSFSPDGAWLVAGNTLLHLESGDVRKLDPARDVRLAIFTPEGDIIGSPGGTLTRYCLVR